MAEQSPWKTPFGRLLIGSSVVAAVVGFSLAAGVAGYFRTSASTEESAVNETIEPAVTDAQTTLDSDDSVDVMSDPNGYADALDELSPAPSSAEVTDSDRSQDTLRTSDETGSNDEGRAGADGGDGQAEELNE
ncbi:MAG: hypothetical protein V4513_02715 [Pseudomonadota bacterium]